VFRLVRVRVRVRARVRVRVRVRVRFRVRVSLEHVLRLRLVGPVLERRAQRVECVLVADLG